MHRAVFFLLASFALAACAPPEQHISTSFKPDEYVPSTQTGTATVVGRSIVQPQEGNPVTCAGYDVALFPDTAWLREVFAILKAGAKPVGPGFGDPRLVGATRRARCDAEGNFKFENVPE